jgi:capsular exopolysaccharide synthesis family protein
MGVGFIISRYQDTIYEASTKVLIMQSLESQSSSVAESDQQLAETFTELLVTRDVLQDASNRLGYRVNSGQLRVERVPNAQMIELVVEDEVPQRAADIANTLVTVFLQQYEEMQAGRFSASEESLQAQLQQVEQQIANLNNQYTENSSQNLDTQISALTKTIADLQAEIRTLNEDIIRLTYDVQPVEGKDELGRTALVTPTPSVEQRIDISVKSDRLNELQNLLDQYQQIYVNLTNSQRGATTGNFDQIQAALALYQQIYSNILNNYEAVRLARLQSTPNILQVEEAVAPGSPVRPQPMNNISLGGILGLFLAGAIAFAVEYLDDTLRTPTDVMNVLQLPVLGYIGEFPRSRSLRNPDQPVMPLVLEQPRSVIAEAFRSLRTNLEFLDPEGDMKTLLIASPGHSEGKSTVAVNLALVMAQAGKRVILLDADMRRPSLHHKLDLSNRVGLSDVLQNRVTLPAAEKIWKDENLTVITSGRLPVNPTELLNSAKMVQVLDDLKNQADWVIIDGPPFALADSLVLSAKADGVLVVIQPNRTVAASAITMLDQLQRAGANTIGITLNRIQNNDTSYYYKALQDYSSYSYDV